MAQRLELQAFLVSLLGSENVYFQPPPTVKMTYPCIMYHRDHQDTRFADNQPYRHKTRYLITVVDPDPDSKIHEKIAALALCSYDRFYAAHGLNHDVYRLFF